MINSLWTAATGMFAQQMNIDVISNNLANVNTNGFKKMRADFQDLFYQTIQTPGAKTSETTLNPTGIQIGLGVKPVAIQKIFSQGSPQSTENPMDMVIDGDGFFQITLPDGTLAYTRAGAFKKDGEGQIITADGYFLEPAITIPQDAAEFTVAADGTVSATLSDGSVSTIGNITLAKFVNPAGLNSIGKNLYVATTASGDAQTGTPGTDGFGGITQNYIEASNVQIVEEMVNMIMAQRAYEVNSKVIKTSDDMISMANGILR